MFKFEFNRLMKVTGSILTLRNFYVAVELSVALKQQICIPYLYTIQVRTELEIIKYLMNF